MNFWYSKSDAMTADDCGIWPNCQQKIPKINLCNREKVLSCTYQTCERTKTRLHTRREIHANIHMKNM